MDDLLLEYDRRAYVDTLSIIKSGKHVRLRDLRPWFVKGHSWKEPDLWIVPDVDNITYLCDDILREDLQKQGKAIKIPYNDYYEETSWPTTIFHITPTPALIEFLSRMIDKELYTPNDWDDLIMENWEQMIMGDNNGN